MPINMLFNLSHFFFLFMVASYEKYSRSSTPRIKHLEVRIVKMTLPMRLEIIPYHIPETRHRHHHQTHDWICS